tara:strand:+ start:4586 stop:5407 length:822 start_codon:yes stop_codon:yes gene_type:complete
MITVITGATSGIGYETAHGLAKKKHDLILVSRNIDKLNQVKEEIENKYSVICDVYQYDLSLIRENISLYLKISKKYNNINFLVNNVGAIFMKRQVTDEGLEKTFSLNHMSYFILSKMFSQQTEPIKIINVSSQAHRNIQLDFDDLQNEKNYNGWYAYKRSKLANIYLTYEMDRKLENTKSTVNCLHPGVVNTNFANNNSLHYKVMASIIKYFGITPKEGASTTLYLTNDEEITSASGLYFNKCAPQESSIISKDKKCSKKLWDYSEKILSNYL